MWLLITLRLLVTIRIMFKNPVLAPRQTDGLDW